MFIALTGFVYIFLAAIILLILFFGLQRPLSAMVNELNRDGFIHFQTGTRELDILASTINRQLKSILMESEAQVEREKIEHELEIAKNIQQSLLPATAPKVVGLDIAAVSHPAMQIGGDFYDFIVLDRERLGVVIADVSGKGIPAALFMALSRALIRVYATQEHFITNVIKKTNALIQEFASLGYFVTLFYAIVDYSAGTISYVRAGHNPPLLYRSEQDEIVTLKGKGVALGISLEIELEAKQLNFSPGDVLLLFTDGVTEAINSQDEEYGVDRLCQILRKSRNIQSDLIITEIIQDINRFTKGGPQFDDITLVVLKR